MTDKKLIQAVRACQRTRGCGSCTLFNECPGRAAYLAMAADRLEALLAENERLKAQVPKWVSAKEQLPKCWNFVLAIDHDGLMSTAYYVGEWHGMLDCDAVTHWMPLPSTEGVE